MIALKMLLTVAGDAELPEPGAILWRGSVALTLVVMVPSDGNFFFANNVI